VGAGKENSRKMRIRVFHPLKAARDEVEVLRSLPEGSSLSPTLFAIFAADLIRELQVQFPDWVVGWVGILWTLSVGWRARCGRGVTPH
jgi:hypothetical protein